MLNVLVWGTGGVAHDMMPQVIEKGKYNILGFIDNNEDQIGTSFMGITIYKPSILKETDFDIIAIMSDYYSDIYNQIISIDSSLVSKIHNKYYFVEETIVRRYEDSEDVEIKTIVERIKTKGISVFNYDFSDEYNYIDVPVFENTENGLYYIMHAGKKMFFPKKYSKSEIVKYYKSLLLEQDVRSPHRYTDERVSVSIGDVIVDAGAAEGIFSLEVIDIVKKIYIIEPDDEWCSALRCTFEAYLDKVEIINGFLSSYNDGKYVMLDSVVHEPIDFIKMDIEGTEYEGLCGAIKTVEQSNGLKMSICSYHSDYDQILIESFMEKNGIVHYTSNGYMWFPYSIKIKGVSSKLVRGIVRGLKA